MDRMEWAGNVCLLSDAMNLIYNRFSGLLLSEGERISQMVLYMGIAGNIRRRLL